MSRPLGYIISISMRCGWFSPSPLITISGFQFFSAILNGQFIGLGIPVLLWPLVFSVALKTSIVEPFLNIYLTSLVEFRVWPRSLFSSLSRAGIKLHNCSIFDIVIDAAYSFNIVILKAFYPLVLLLSIRNSSAYLFIFL